MSDEKGQPCIIDPAIYFGCGEADIAMTRLFGGFDDVYVTAYNGVKRLLPGYEERLAIYELYYLLVHLNLFGSGYFTRVMAIVRKFQ